MKGKERAALRKQANTLAPIFQIGKGDIGDAMIEAIDAALQKRELIKIAVLETSGLTARDAAEVLSVATRRGRRPVHRAAVRAVPRAHGRGVTRSPPPGAAGGDGPPAKAGTERDMQMTILWRALPGVPEREARDAFCPPCAGAGALFAPRAGAGRQAVSAAGGGRPAPAAPEPDAHARADRVRAL